jgi:hypothetical protein
MIMVAKWFRSPERAPVPRLDPCRIRVVSTGRANSGKTTLVDQICSKLLMKPLPSGLHFQGESPGEVACLLRHLHNRDDLQHQTIRLATTTSRSIDLHLCEGGSMRATLSLEDPVGQLFTGPALRGEKILRMQYEDFCRTSPRADVYWQFLPCVPREYTSEHVKRLRTDICLTVGYLQDALNRREGDQPAALAIIVPRIDVRYPDADTARARFRRELLDALATLLRPLTGRPELTEVALFPVSSLGFGTTRALELSKPGPDPFCSVTFGEPDWRLLPDVDARPFNVVPLAVWTLLAGLRQRVVTDLELSREAVHLCRTLKTDLQSLRGWYFPIKNN